MTFFTDRELLDFLDGTLPATRQRELTEALLHDPDLETRLMEMDSVAPMVRDAFAGVGNTRTIEKLLPALNTPRKEPLAWRPMLIAASVAAAIAVFGTFNTLNRGSEAGGWMQQVAAYQALYSVETIKTVSATQDELIAQLTQAESALNISLPKEALSRLEGLELRRTQMLAFEGQPLAQIVFSDNNGRPIALCILKTDDAPQGDVIQMAQLKGLESAAFSNAGFGYLLIGPTDASTINGLADDIKAVFARG